MMGLWGLKHVEERGNRDTVYRRKRIVYQVGKKDKINYTEMQGQQNIKIYTNSCLHTVDPPHDEKQACSKYVKAYYWNRLRENSASCWFILHGYITMHGQQNIKFENN
jgi:hypothetical protein